MAPAKRAASKPKGRPQKAPKTAAAAKAAEPRFAILDELRRGGVTESCLDMLAAALPHVLATPKEERHQFQHSVLENLDNVSGKDRARRETVLEEATACARNFEAELSTATEKAAAAQAEEAARNEKKVESETRVSSITGAADAAAQTLQEAKSKVEDSAAQVNTAQSAKDSFVTKLGEFWPPLRDATFEKKDWRQRQKAITQVMHLIKPIAPESLTACLPLALKEGLDSRGAFGKLVVEEGEKILNGHTEQLESAIVAAKAAAAEDEAQYDCKETLAKEAAAARDEAQDDCIQVENSWVEAQQKSYELAQFIRIADTTRAEHAAAAQQAKESLEALDAAMAEFKAQAEPPAAAPAEAVSEPPAAAGAESDPPAAAETVSEPPAAAAEVGVADAVAA